METPGRSALRNRLYRTVFGTTTPAGKLFDVVLLWAILISVLLVMLESVPAIKARYGHALYLAELIFTGLFTVEYLLRLWIVQKPRHYVLSFFGIVDLLSILPTFLSLIIGGAQSLMVIRVLRLIRVFRVLKLARFINEAGMLGRALVASRRKIMVFLLAVLTIVVIFGTVMYLVESPEAGFTSIPRSIYWTIVTLTTVGYGDIAPQTTIGQMIASMIMILGYSIIAVPTGIVGVELAKSANPGKECMTCHATGHLGDARFCRRCGAELPV